LAFLKDTTIDDTGSLNLPKGTTAQRPASPEQGMIRFNTDYNWIEWYTGTKWVCNHIGQTPAQAILDLDLLPPGYGGGRAYINPALALGTGDNPFLVTLEADQDNNFFVKTRTAFTNGIISNSQTTTNCVDKVRSEGPNGSNAYIGQFFGLGNVDVAYNGTGGSAVNRSTTYVTGDNNRRFQKIEYFNFATNSNFSNAEVEAMNEWSNILSPYSYQIAVETDDDNDGFSDFSSGIAYGSSSSSNSQSASQSPAAGHPVGIHKQGSNGAINGDDGSTNLGGMSAANNNTNGFFLMTRSRWSSNAVLATRYNTTEQNLFGKEGSARGQNVNLDFNQSETLPLDFILPDAVSLMIHTGGGNAWGYLTYTDSRNNDSLENFILFGGKNIL